MSRLFAALWPPPEVLARLQQLERPNVEGLRWTTEDQWHVTLQFLGEAGERQMTEAMRAARWGRPLKMRIGPAVTLLRQEIVCLPRRGSGARRARPTGERSDRSCSQLTVSAGTSPWRGLATRFLVPFWKA